MRLTNKVFTGLILGALSLSAPLSSVWAAPAPAKPERPVEDRVRKALVTIPYLSVFDNLSYRVDNGVVTLSGQVTQPFLKDDAERSVRSLAGVASVNDQIEVLPLSPFDDGIRRQTFRALTRTSSLYRYFMGVNPSIRIVVKNGRVTLDGVVDNSMDSQLAFMAANQVHGVFHVTNNLRLEPRP